MSTQLTEYEANGEKITLSPDIIKRYLVNGDADKVSDQEVMMFLSLCKAQQLNPFIREAYLIKYGNAPASIITGKEVFTKRAYKNERFAGMQAGVVVVSRDGSRLIEREGSMVLEGDQLVGGWAKVYVKGYVQPIYASVSMKEYSSGKSTWAKMPGVMIRKCALVAALREAFPEDFQGLYTAEEMQQANNKVDMVALAEDDTPIDITHPKTEVIEQPAQTVVKISEEQANGLLQTCEKFKLDVNKLCGMYQVQDIHDLDTEQLAHIKHNFNTIKSQLKA